MGGSWSSSHVIAADQDSPTTPGAKCVLVTSLSMSKEDLMDGCVMKARYPVGPLRPLLKVFEATDHGPDEFTVKATLDGAKLEEHHMGDGTERDRVAVWMKCKLEGDTIRGESYVDPEGEWANKATKTGKVFWTACTKVLEDPVRVEYWCEVQGKRYANSEVTGHWLPWIKAIIDIATSRKVHFKPDTDSLHEPGQKSLITDSLDDLSTFDELWKGLTNHAVIYPDLVTTEMSDSEVYVGLDGGIEPPDGGWRVEVDKEAAKIVRTKELSGKLTEVQTTVLHKEPLRIELWRVMADGSRDSSLSFARHTAMVCDQLIKKPDSGSWFW
uniref:Uncharacterized protein n=1 Tax=Alexandrium catenella TaxID=2925 RepID=A0A7S1SDS0_ALECA|mmetsp:Transcript_97030/g.257813  ORF Transcript_97030/g.257813 Transcript_97030/m.257813 type:complete len:327 (+) Transcript_97030:62-1042(+)